MTFTSASFLIFFPTVVILYNLIPQKARLYFLLAASIGFYALMQPFYIILLALVSFLTYGCAFWIDNEKDDKKKARKLTFGIIGILLPLLLFKYYNPLTDAINSAINGLGINSSIRQISWMLPVGISFYTFMAIGYLVDIYNEEISIEKNFAAVCLFLSFFPYVLSGPIERAGNMFPQLKNFQRSKYEDLTGGLKLMLWGYFMKLCVADRLGLYTDTVFSDIQEYSGTTFAFAAILYPFRVYGDLGGYSLIAIGVARCLGINIRPNFKRPFFATSMSEFWRRWHMSLITWLTDYIYTPISFILRRWSVWGIITAIFATFIISGLWHGAAATFLVWGLIQALYLSIEALAQKRRVKLETKFRLTSKWWYLSLCCIGVFVMFAFSEIFGRCANLEDAITVIGKIFSDHSGFYFNASHCSLGISCLFLLLIKDYFDEFHPNKVFLFENKHLAIRWLSYLICLALILVLGCFDGNSFIYFKF